MGDGNPQAQFAVVERVALKVLSAQVTLGQGLGGGEAVSHAAIWGKGLPADSSCKGPEVRMCCCV